MSMRTAEFEYAAGQLGEELRRMDRAEVVRRHGMVKVSVTASRATGNCKAGSEGFATMLRREWERQYGEEKRGNSITVRDLLALVGRVEENLLTYYSGLGGWRMWQAIAGAILRQQVRDAVKAAKRD